MRSNRHRHLHPIESCDESNDELSALHRTIESGGWCAASLQGLADVAGGIEALATISFIPHPAEPFDWSAVPADDVDLVSELLERIEVFCEAHLDDEYLTILRRLVARAACHPEHPLRRRAATPRIAAALVWIALKGNLAIGSRCRFTAGLLWFLLEVTSCTDLGRTIAHKLSMTARVDPVSYSSTLPTDPIALGSADLLHCATRRWLAERRDDGLEVAAQLHAQDEARRLVVDRGDGTREIRGREVRVVATLKGVCESGRAAVMVVLGDSLDDPGDVLALSVPDAHRLVDLLDAALGAPLRLHGRPS